MLRRQAVEAAADHQDAKRFRGLNLDLLGPFSPLGGMALMRSPLGDPLTPKLLLVAAGRQVAPELGQNCAGELCLLGLGQRLEAARH